MGLNLDYVCEHIDLVLGYTQLPAVSVLSANHTIDKPIYFTAPRRQQVYLNCLNSLGRYLLECIDFIYNNPTTGEKQESEIFLLTIQA